MARVAAVQSRGGSGPVATTGQLRVRPAGAHHARVNTPTPGTPPAAPENLSEDERTWGMIAHFSSLAFFVLPPIGCVIGPLVVWALKKDRYPFATEAAKEAINFNVAVLIGYVVCAVLAFAFVGLVLGTALFIYWLVMTIIAGVKASEGFHYRHRFTLRILR
jgi:uncharacterized Tic20 family protein